MDMDHTHDANSTRKRKNSTSEKENEPSKFVKSIYEDVTRDNVKFVDCLMSYPAFQKMDRDFISKIDMIKICDNWTSAFIFTKDKMVYAIGTHTNQFGLGSTCSHFKKFDKPHKLDFLSEQKIKKLIYFTYTYEKSNAFVSIILTKEGRIYSWGINEYNLLGNGESMYYNVYIPIPVITLFKEVVIDIVCSSRHVLALTESGNLYTWGEGLSNIPEQKFSFSTGMIKQICCGEDVFNIVLTHSGNVYSWGNNNVNQLGRRSGTEIYDDNIGRVTVVSNAKIVKVACGYSNVIALADDGSLFHWGSYSELMVDIQRYQIDTSKMGKIVDIAALPTKRRSVAVNSNGCVYVWGQYHHMCTLTPIGVVQISNMMDVFNWNDIPYAICVSPLVSPNNVDTETSDVVESFETAFDDPSMSDFAVHVEGQVIHVHKTILNIRSSYFRTMFQNTWEENNQNVLNHDQFSYDIYKSFLRYLYTGKIDLSLEKIVGLYTLADSYLETKLKNKCMQMLKREITLETAILVYKNAIKYNVEKELQELCFPFILDNIQLIKKTEEFTQLDDKVQNHILLAAISQQS